MVLQLMPGTVVEEGTRWAVAVNLNQNLLGRLIVVATRTIDSVASLTPNLHVVPRYARTRMWADESYDDPHFGSLFGPEQRRLDTEHLAALADLVRRRLPAPDAASTNGPAPTAH